MNIRAVRLFRMIVKSGSLAAAANRLGMSVSAASRMLGVLEHEFKLKLFSRENRRLDLTQDGREFLQRTQHILEGLERLTDIANEVRSTEDAPLRLVSTLPLAKTIYAPALDLWRQEHPEARSVLNIETRFDLESKVAAREYNLGILSLPVENAIVDLEVQPLVAARHEIAMSPSHPLAQATTITPDDLVSLDFVALKPGQRWRDRLDVLAASKGFKPNIISETSSTVAALELARRGVGVVLVDRMHVGLEDETQLVLRPTTPDAWVDYCLVTGAGRTSRATSDFANILRKWLQDCSEANVEVADSLRIVGA